MLKKHFTLVALAALAIVLGWHAAPIAVRAQQTQFKPNPAPLVAQQRQSFYSSRGILTTSLKTKIGIKKDGSRSEIREALAPDGTTVLMQIILDIPGQQRISLNGMAQGKTTYALDRKTIEAMLEASGDPSCGIPQPLDHVQYLGVDAVHGFKQVAGQRREIWRAPGLGCFDLKVVSLQKAADGNDSRTEIETLALELRDPDPEMFVLPEWPEMTPSEAHAAISKRYPSAPRIPASSDSAADSAYRSARPPKPQ